MEAPAVYQSELVKGSSGSKPATWTVPLWQERVSRCRQPISGFSDDL